MGKFGCNRLISMKITQLFAELQNHLDTYGDDEILSSDGKPLKEVGIKLETKEDSLPEHFATLVFKTEE
jgi:hypothetical protein